ncbi:WXG100 family type VII secretion target [Saccharopolyspora rosea]|uniref:ESAT-6-like protein n=1 Tax=Saccharopolyspora rosea TaxID=524884 RepID=A0ABW3FNR1_9PSEU|nr:WXG100 family type VII secretion target [Saccharopolyspora rosea]
MADEIQYQYPIIQSGVDKMRQVTSRLEQGITEMENQTKTLLSDWDAQAAEAYRVKAQEIAETFRQMNQTLTNVTQAVDAGANDFKTKDGQLAQQFE